MTSELTRFLATSGVIALLIVGVAAACGGGPSEEQVGKVGQSCFPGDYCDPGLTCVAIPIPADGSSLGTDGGQCYDLRSGHTPEAESLDGDDLEDAGTEGTDAATEAAAVDAGADAK